MVSNRARAQARGFIPLSVPWRRLFFLFGCSFGPLVLAAPTLHPDRAPLGRAVKLSAVLSSPRTSPVRLRSEEFLGSGAPGANWDRVRQAAAGRTEFHVILQLSGPLTGSVAAGLAGRGVRLAGYLPENAFFARVPASFDASQWPGVGIVWLGAIYPEDKQSREMAAGAIGTWALRADGNADLRVKTYEDVSSTEALEALAAVGATLLRASEALHDFTVRLPVERLPDLVSLDGVRWVEEVPPPPQPMLDLVRTNTQAEVLQEAPYGLSGKGVAVGVWDVGLVDRTQPDFGDRVTIMSTNSQAGVQLHATHVAGIVGGSGSQSAAYGGYEFQWRGVAPGVKIYSYDTSDPTGGYPAAISPLGVAVSQNSWGITLDAFFANCNLYGTYSHDAPSYDQIINGRSGGRISIAFAAGNARKNGGTNGCVVGSYFNIGPPATAKDVITVGAINADDNSMTSFSSWGPVQDGRLKPELVAPGSRVASPGGVTSTAVGNGYAVLQGTSMATPAVSGAIALLIEDFRARFNGENPRPSTVKALLLHTAQDLTGGSPGLNPGPDYASGYGRLQIKDAVEQMRQNGFLVDRVGPGQTNRYLLPVPVGTAAVKLTLAWDDPAAVENAAIALVNDLDLVVFDPNGDRRFPWTLDPANPAAPAVRTQEDHLNVVEQVLADDGVVAGDWVIEVVGHNVPVNAPQAYSLAFSPAGIASPTFLVAGTPVLNDTSAGNGNGSLDPGELIYETLPLLNQDGPTATNVSVHLETDTPGVSLLTPESAYPSVPPGATATNLTPFSYLLTRDFPCGSPVEFRYVVAQGDLLTTNYFSRVVGSYAVTNVATNVFASVDGPVVIPDVGPAASVLPINVAGTIQTVQVRLRIDHTWMGDLLIRLQHPDGSTVTLVPANTLLGANFGTGDCSAGPQFTVFDDAARLPLPVAGAPFVGTYRPASPLSALAGKSVQGSWRLLVNDVAIEDVGSVLCWQVQIAYQQLGYVCHSFNQPPVTQNLSVVVPYATPVAIALPGTDLDGDQLTFGVQSLPQHGVLSGLDPRTGAVTYTPRSGYIGPDEFRFSVSDGLTNSSSATVSLVVQAPGADLAITQTGSIDRVVLGQNLTYQLLITNRGPNTASHVVLTDVLPSSVSLVSAAASQGGVVTQAGSVSVDVGAMPVGSSATVSLVVTPSALGIITNSATLANPEEDTTPEDNSVSSVTTVNHDAELGLSMAAVPDALLVGSSLTWQFTVTNRGPDPATAVRFSDTLPVGLEVLNLNPSQGAASVVGNVVNCDLGTLPAQASATVEIKVALTVSGTLTNQAQIAANEFDFDTSDNTITTVRAVAPVADLAVTATAEPNPAGIQTPLTYSILVTNRGPSAATGTHIQSQLPDVLTLLSASVSQGTWANVNGTFSADLGTLPAGASATLEITVQPTQAGSLTNQVTVSAVELDPNLTDNSAEVVVAVEPSADLALIQAGMPPAAVLGSVFTIVLTVTNHGPAVASNATLIDTLPAEFEVLSLAPSQGTTMTEPGQFTCQFGALPPGQTATVIVALKAAQPGIATNSAAISSGELDFHPENNLASSATRVALAADLSLSMNGPTGPVPVGSNLTYTLSITNAGPNPATGVIATGSLPTNAILVSVQASQGTATEVAGVLTGELGALAVGASATIQVVLTPTTDGTLTNTAQVASEQVDPKPEDNQAKLVTAVLYQAELSVTQTADSSSALAGQLVTYTLTVSNSGPHAASGVVLEDVLPAGADLVSVTLPAGTSTNEAGTLTCQLGSLDVGAEVVVQVVVRPTAAGVLHNTARVHSAELQTTADQPPQIVYDNSLTTLNAYEGLAPGASEFGDEVQLAGNASLYELTDFAFEYYANLAPEASKFMTLRLYANDGPVSFGRPTPGTLLFDSTVAGPIVLQSGLHSVEINGNGLLAEVPRDFTWAVTIQGLTTGETAGLLLYNPPTVGSSTPDFWIRRSGLWDWYILNGGNTPANFGARAIGAMDPTVAETIVNVAPVADLALTSTPIPAVAVLGQDVILTLTVTNFGPSPATSVRLTNELPAGWGVVSAQASQGTVLSNAQTLVLDLGTVTPGGGASLALVLSAAQLGMATNWAGVGGVETDGDLGNNVLVVATDVLVDADLAISVIGPAPPVVVGSNAAYTITVTNLGPHAATGVVLTDETPPAAAFVSATGSTGAAIYGGGVLTYNLGNIPPQSAIIVTLLLNPTAAGSLTNFASVTANEFDPDPSNNRAVTLSTASGQADLAVAVQDVTPTAIFGQTFQYAITLTNSGPQRATGLRLTHVLPVGWQLTAVQSGTGTYTNANGTLLFDLGTLDSGSADLIVLATVPQRLGPAVSTASVQGNELDFTPADNAVTHQVTVAAAADLGVTVQAPGGPVSLGALYSYSIVVTNRGPNDSSLVSLTNQVPPGFQVVSATPSSGTASFAGQTVAANLGSLAAGAQASVLVVLSAVAAGSSPNVVAVTGPEIDLNPSNNQATFVTSVFAEADLAVTSLRAPPALILGQDWPCTVVVTNNGPSSVQGVVVTNFLAAQVAFLSAVASQGTFTQDGQNVIWSVGKLVAGGGASIRIVGQPSSAGAFTNTATVSAPIQDTAPLNNTNSLVSVVYPPPVLAVLQSAVPSAPLLENQVVWTVTLTNQGASLAPDVLLLAAFSVNVSFVSANASQGKADIQAPGIVVHFGDVPPGLSATLTAVLQPTSAGDLVCQASVFAPADYPGDALASVGLTIPVISVPRVTWDRGGNRLNLSWPAVASDLIVETTDSLLPAQWTTLQNPRTVTGDTISVSIKFTGVSGFYRLRRP